MKTYKISTKEKDLQRFKVDMHNFYQCLVLHFIKPDRLQNIILFCFRFEIYTSEKQLICYIPSSIFSLTQENIFIFEVNA